MILPYNFLLQYKGSRIFDLIIEQIPFVKDVVDVGI